MVVFVLLSQLLYFATECSSGLVNLKVKRILYTYTYGGVPFVSTTSPTPLPAPRLGWPSNVCWCPLKNEILRVHFLSAPLEILSEGSKFCRFLKRKKSPRCSKTCHPYGGGADKKWNVPWRSAQRVHCTRLTLFVLFLESMRFPSFVLFSLGQRIELYFAAVTEELLTVLLLWSSLLVGHVFIVLVRHFSLPPWIKYHSIAFLRWRMAFFSAMVQRGKVWKVRDRKFWKFSLIRNLQIFQRHFLLLVRFARSALWALVPTCKCH